MNFSLRAHLSPVVISIACLGYSGLTPAASKVAQEKAQQARVRLQKLSINHSEQWMRLADHDNDTVAQCLYTQDHDKERATIKAIAVTDTLARRNLGTTLLKNVIKDCFQHNCLNIVTKIPGDTLRKSFLEKNISAASYKTVIDTAIQFFQHNGFEQITELQNPFGSVFMRLPLVRTEKYTTRNALGTTEITISLITNNNVEVGEIIYDFDPTTQLAHITSIRIHTDYRQRGYGSYLVRAALRDLLPQGYTIEDIRVTPENAAGRDCTHPAYQQEFAQLVTFWQKNGFNVTNFTTRRGTRYDAFMRYNIPGARADHARVGAGGGDGGPAGARAQDMKD